MAAQTTFTTPPSLPPAYLLHPSAFQAAYPHVRGMLAGAVVFHPSSGDGGAPRILLVRRAPTDSWPLLWETPGGSVDIPDDASLVAAAVRELWEETGLRATRVLAAAYPRAADLLVSAGPPLNWVVDEASGLSTFIETGQVWARITVVVACDPAGDEVVLQPEEHVEAAWVTEDEVRGEQLGTGEESRPLEFICEGLKLTLLAAFRLWRETDGWKAVEA